MGLDLEAQKLTRQGKHARVEREKHGPFPGVSASTRTRPGPGWGGGSLGWMVDGGCSGCSAVGSNFDGGRVDGG